MHRNTCTCICAHVACTCTYTYTYTCRMCIGHTQIWVCSPHNGSGYYGLREEINDALSLEHFQATLSGSGDKYARTGYLGFMMKSDKTDRTGGEGV